MMLIAGAARKEGSMRMHGALEVTGGVLGATLTVAQLDTSGEFTSHIAKGGAVAVVGLLFYMFMRLSARQQEALAKAHVDAVARLAADTKEAAQTVAKENKEAIALLVSGHKDAVDRIEAAHLNSANKFDAGADKIVLAVQANVARCAQTAAVMEAAARK